MKVVEFNIPASNEKTVIFQEDILPYCYQHLHRHEEIQLTLIKKGTGTLIVGDNTYKYKENEIYLIGSDIPHLFKSDEDYFTNTELSTHMIFIFFNPHGKSLSTIFDLPELKNQRLFFDTYPIGFRLPANHFDEISAKILNIKYASQLEQLLKFFELLKSLVKVDNIVPFAPEAIKKINHKYDDERMKNIQNFISKNYHKDLTLPIVAEKAYMTPQAFCRYFKKHTGLTFVSFLNGIRVNEACRKLAEGGYESVSSIAMDCGFTNMPNFNRVFKLIVGKSPSLYINNLNQSLLNNMSTSIDAELYQQY